MAGYGVLRVGQPSLSSGADAAALVSFPDAQGHAGQLTASAVTPALVPGVPSPTLRIDAVTVSEFMERTSYAYWPKLTLTASAGTGTVTVTRLQFEFAGGGGAMESGRSADVRAVAAVAR